MKDTSAAPRVINSISQWHELAALPKPEHPLISFIKHPDIKDSSESFEQRFVMNFYIISIKKSFKGKMRYGKAYYDFDEGTMSFVSPGQVLAVDSAADRDCLGWSLLFHPDFIRNYGLGKTIKDFHFFSYDVNEALHLSEKEEKMIDTLLKNIEQEYHYPIDAYSQDVMVTQLELLLTYANRFYNRQFLTRKTASTDLLMKLEALLHAYFDDASGARTGLPTVQYLSEALHVSPHYLSDMLRTTTGQNTQQHIHNALIEKAKERLTTTSLSVSEIAYGLGFEHPQSFNKLFKTKTAVSPLQFRSAFN